MCIGGDGLQRQRRRAQPLSGDLLDQREHIVSFQRVIQDPGSDIRGEIGQVEGQRQVTEVAQPVDEHRLLPRCQLQPTGDRRWRDHEHGGAHLVADFANVFEGLFESQQGVDPVVVLALRDVGADLGSAVDQSLVLENAQRFANGIAGHREFRGQVALGRQPVRIRRRVNLLAQHIGDPAGTVGPGSANGYRLSHVATLTQLSAAFWVGDRGRRRWV